MPEATHVQFDPNKARRSPLPDLVPVNLDFPHVQLDDAPFDDPIVPTGPFTEFPLLFSYPYVGNTPVLGMPSSPYDPNEYPEATFTPFVRQSFARTLNLAAKVLSENRYGLVITEAHRARSIQAAQFTEFLILTAAAQLEVPPVELIGSVATMVALPNNHPPHNSGTAADILQARASDPNYAANIAEFLRIIEFLEADLAARDGVTLDEFHRAEHSSKILELVSMPYPAQVRPRAIDDRAWLLNNENLKEVKLDKWEQEFEGTKANALRKYQIWKYAHIKLYEYQNQVLEPCEYGLTFGDGGPRSQTNYYEKPYDAAVEHLTFGQYIEARNVRRQQYWLLQAVNKAIRTERNDRSTNAAPFAQVFQYAEEMWHVDAEGGLKAAATFGGKAWNGGMELLPEHRGFNAAALVLLYTNRKRDSFVNYSMRFFPDISRIPRFESNEEVEKRLISAEAAVKYAIDQGIISESDLVNNDPRRVYNRALANREAILEATN